MNLYDIFETDKNFEKEGIVIEVTPGVSFCVARSGGSNKKYLNALSNLAKPYQRQIDNESIDREKMEELVMKAFIRGCLISWEGVTDHEGNAMALTEDNAVRLFSDLPDLLAALRDASDKVSNYRKEAVEEIAGKLADTSPG